MLWTLPLTYSIINWRKGRRPCDITQLLSLSSHQIAKQLTSEFKKHGLKITIEHSAKYVKFLDVTLTLQVDLTALTSNRTILSTTSTQDPIILLISLSQYRNLLINDFLPSPVTNINLTPTLHVTRGHLMRVDITISCNTINLPITRTLNLGKKPY